MRLNDENMEGSSVRLNKYFQVPVAKDDALLSFVAVSGDLATNTKSCGLYAGY